MLYTSIEMMYVEIQKCSLCRERENARERARESSTIVHGHLTIPKQNL